MINSGSSIRVAVVIAAVVSAGAGPVRAQSGGANGDPPSYLSLKASEVNLRQGPGTDYPIAWVFRRAGLPVKVVRTFKTWREVQDFDGTKGWIAERLLSRRRTALVVAGTAKPGQPPPQEPLSEGPNPGSRAVALVEAGVIADVHQCDGRWCQVSVGDFLGYVEQRKLWGVEQGEVIQ